MSFDDEIERLEIKIRGLETELEREGLLPVRFAWDDPPRDPRVLEVVEAWSKLTRLESLAEGPAMRSAKTASWRTRARQLKRTAIEKGMSWPEMLDHVERGLVIWALDDPQYRVSVKRDTIRKVQGFRRSDFPFPTA